VSASFTSQPAAAGPWIALMRWRASASHCASVFSAALKSETQWLALARHRLSAIHGAAAAGWDV
jgi:hypothetical protein